MRMFKRAAVSAMSKLSGSLTHPVAVGITKSLVLDSYPTYDSSFFTITGNGVVQDYSWSGSLQKTLITPMAQFNGNFKVTFTIPDGATGAKLSLKGAVSGPNQLRLSKAGSVVTGAQGSLTNYPLTPGTYVIETQTGNGYAACTYAWCSSGQSYLADLSVSYVPAALASGKGYVAGGWSNVPTITTLVSIEAFNFGSEAISTVSATLDDDIQGSVGISSIAAGYIACGNGNTGNARTITNKLTFATETISTLASATSVRKDGPAGFASPTTGYLAGGIDASSVRTTTVDSFSLSTGAVAQSVGSVVAGRNRVASMQTQTVGYLAGGSTTSSTNGIDSITFATLSSTSLSATLSTASRTGGCGLSSTLAGYVLGGNSSTYRATIDKLTFASGTCAVVGAALSVARGESPSPMSSSANGYAAGGYAPSQTSTEIDGLAFATDTSVNPSAALSGSRCYAAGMSYPG